MTQSARERGLAGTTATNYALGTASPSASAAASRLAAHVGPPSGGRAQVFHEIGGSAVAPGGTRAGAGSEQAPVTAVLSVTNESKPQPRRTRRMSTVERRRASIAAFPQFSDGMDIAAMAAAAVPDKDHSGPVV